ncbi:transcription/translation regulatory transformer protein RfaH [Oceanisphaera pacifica]|uniref:Transcription antitermination protein RfaH n=1 Tax=Oceanisphaera pacifica TaxID=2818389 RepID=A0ABS3NIF0_9GAMM|nr:transcription/translation regulatory transformer protein RfaH [Oceanisphaera pacifica]MBO1520354.1 transcription/translation regulatory transformer protein RfaH [Oceanisphaera pacifica]
MQKWYLAHCRPREEERALQNLSNQNIEAFYPYAEVKKLYRRKLVTRTEALFPGYIFIKADLNVTSASTIGSTRGVRHLVRFGAGPCEVPTEVVIELMHHCDSDELRDKLTDLPQKGDSVRIETGPFAGLEAIYQEADGETRAILLLTLLQNATPTSFANDEFSRVPKT